MSPGRKKTSTHRIPARLIQTVCDKIAENKQVRRTLPVWGRLHIDRQLPFLCVYRRPPDRPDLGTERLVMAEASYLTASGERQLRKSLSTLVGRVTETLTREFGAFLIVEIWSTPEETGDVESWTASEAGVADNGKQILVPKPSFQIVTYKTRTPSGIIDSLKTHLERVRIRKVSAEVAVFKGRKIAPPKLPPVLSSTEVQRLGCHVIGIEVRPIFRDPDSGKEFPHLRRALIRALGLALKRTFFDFARTQTTHRPPHYHSLGRRAAVKAVWEIDQKLSEVSNAFDFLLQVTPVNGDAAWSSFRRRKFEKTPLFHYRPRSFDPSDLKRQLWNIDIGRLEDPTLGQLFRDKRTELDTQITMLDHIETRRFYYNSLELFGTVDDNLMQLALDLLNGIPSRSKDESRGGQVDAETFAERAQAEIAHYKEIYPELTSKVQIRDDITGLMVSRGNLLVGRSTKIPNSRIEALIQHEVGTHILTYVNGRAQPFRQLYSGLSGYEELQEGLAVFAEYLVGGLSRPRLRLLAARVLAGRRLTEGADFCETFREIDRDYDFARRAAFSVTMRIFRGGGLTKDIVYLRGLAKLLNHLKRGGDLESLFVGKIGVDQIPIIRELRWRKVLLPPPLRPRYMDMPGVAERLDRAKGDLAVIDLIPRSRK